MRILCAFSAVALWLFVTYTEDPEARLWFRDIPVTYVGAESLAARNLVFIEKDEPAEINIKLAGRRSAMQRLLDTDIKVVVDYSAVQEKGACTLPVQVTLGRNDVQILKLSHTFLSYQVDELETAEKNITITSSGAETLHLSQFDASPATVKVTAPKSLMPHLSASVHVDLSGGQAADTYPITVTDQRGQTLPEGAISLSQNAVEIFATRDLEVSVEAMNLPQDKVLEAVVYEPARVPVRGKLSDLLKADKAEGVSPVWVNAAVNPASVGPVQLTFPENVQIVDKDSATVTYYFKNQ